MTTYIIIRNIRIIITKVVANQEFNKMTLTNVATIMAPNLFLQPKSRKHLRVKENEVNMAKGTVFFFAFWQKLSISVLGYLFVNG